MKILHVINDLEIGGAQKLLHDLLLLQIADTSTQPKCFVLRKSDSGLERDLKEKGVEIISADAKAFSLATLKKLRRLIKEADVVHAHLFPSNYLVALANAGSGKRLVFTEHSTHNKRRDHAILRLPEKIMYGRYDRLACISGATAVNLTKWIGPNVAEPRIRIIHNGIDLSRFSKTMPQTPEEIFGRPGIPLLMISRFTASKDHATAIKALTFIENDDVFLAFAGDGETRQEMERLAEECGVANRVKFLGSRSDTPELIRSTRIGIQSSNWEGFGLTAIEMMAGATPVIASDVEGLNGVVKGAGILFTPGDEMALANEIKKLLSDQKLYEDLQNRGKKRAAEYSISATAEKYKKLYQELAAR